MYMYFSGIKYFITGNVVQCILPKPATDLFCKYRNSVQTGAVNKAWRALGLCDHQSPRASTIHYTVEYSKVDEDRRMITQTKRSWNSPLWHNNKLFCKYQILSTVETGRISWSQRYTVQTGFRDCSSIFFFLRPMFTCQLMPSHLVISIATMSVHACCTQRWL